jgi:hypothetical protein
MSYEEHQAQGRDDDEETAARQWNVILTLEPEEEEEEEEEEKEEEEEEEDLTATAFDETSFALEEKPTVGEAEPHDNIEEATGEAHKEEKGQEQDLELGTQTGAKIDFADAEENEAQESGTSTEEQESLEIVVTPTEEADVGLPLNLAVPTVVTETVAQEDSSSYGVKEALVEEIDLDSYYSCRDEDFDEARLEIGVAPLDEAAMELVDGGVGAGSVASTEEQEPVQIGVAQTEEAALEMPHGGVGAVYRVCFCILVISVGFVLGVVVGALTKQDEEQDTPSTPMPTQIEPTPPPTPTEPPTPLPTLPPSTLPPRPADGPNFAAVFGSVVGSVVGCFAIIGGLYKFYLWCERRKNAARNKKFIKKRQIRGSRKEEFGRSIAINHDSSDLVVGSPGGSGKVTFFHDGRNRKPIPGVTPELGRSVSMSHAGDRAAAGALGCVCVYEKRDTANPKSWTCKPIRPPNGPDASFGWAVALSRDGNTLIVGSPTCSRRRGGQAYAFRCDTQSDIWKPLGNDLKGDEAGDAFGSTVAINRNGSIIAVGATEGAHQHGYVRVFEIEDVTFTAWSWKGPRRKSKKIWRQAGSFQGAQEGENFGSSLSLSASGKQIAVGASQVDMKGTGYVRVYKFVNGQWNPDGNDIPGTGPRGRFGHAVSLSEHGTHIAIGAPSDGNGCVKAFRKIEDIWCPHRVGISGSINHNKVGTSVAISADGSKVWTGCPTSSSAAKHAAVFYLE